MGWDEEQKDWLAIIGLLCRVLVLICAMHIYPQGVKVAARQEVTR